MNVGLVIAGVAALGLIAIASSDADGGSAADDKSFAARWDVLRPYAELLEIQTDWHGLARFLRVVAWMESRGRLDAVHDGGIGRGPFALHSTTSSVQALGGQSSLYLLEDPAIAVATAATHAFRLLTCGGWVADDVTWGDVRAGWAIPAWTCTRDDDEWGDITRNGVIERFAARAAQLGDAGLESESAYLAGWPGLRWALDVVGRPDVYVDPNSKAA